MLSTQLSCLFSSLSDIAKAFSCLWPWDLSKQLFVCGINVSLPSIRKDFNFPCNLNVAKCKCNFMTIQTTLTRY